ncbi:MAG TPA: alpha/beta hydrolase, partial [Pyrinomonadaceae bacterium]|jgi:pimeloyl-ACP methyl ester carboxylesterase|nr:alpha/beta hydrolase [Pyrinomonadaceae bacterium]
MNACKHRLFLSAFVLVLTATQTASAQKAESRFAKLDDARIHYVNYGKGDEALVLIHGWSQSADAWRDNVADLSKRNRVIVLELPGHGQSDKPQTTYSMDYFARAVDAVMGDAKVKRAVLVGHSMGTPVARQFYRKYPDKTLGIVIVDGSLRPFGDKAMIDQMMAGFRGPKYQDAVNQMMGFIAGPNLSAEVKQRISAASMSTPQHVLVSAFEGMLDDSIWGEDKINVPVLAIMAKTALLPPNAEESFRAVAPKLDFEIFDGVGHFLMMEKPKEFDAAVIAWLDKNSLLKK